MAAAFRFPGPALAIAALAFYVNWTIARSPAYQSEAELFDWVWPTAIAFFFAGAVHVLCEARNTSRIVNAAAGLITAVATGAIAHYFMLTQSKWDFLIYGGILALMIAPFLRRSASQGAIWMYNMRLALVALFGFLSGLAIALAHSAIYAAINYLLLGHEGSDQIWQHIWWTCSVFVGPFIALGLMPKDLDEPLEIAEHRNTILERGMRIIVSYVLIPLVLVFAAVLHAFAVRLLMGAGSVTGVKLNEVGSIVTSFILGAAATWLIAWPWRNVGYVILRWYQRWWFAALVVPLALLVYVLWGRVNEAGITANRYGLIIVAAWAALLIIYAAWKRAEADMRLILTPLAAALFLGGFGPWGATGATISSQFARLESVLATSGVLINGKPAETAPKLKGIANDTAHESLKELLNAGGVNRLAPWFDEKTFAKWQAELDPGKIGSRYWSWQNNHNAAVAIRQRLGIGAPTGEHIFVNYQNNEPVNLETGNTARLAGPFYVNDPKTPYSNAAGGMELTHNKSTITIAFGGRTETIQVDVFLSELKKHNSRDGINMIVDPKDPMILEMSGGSRLLVQYASANLDNPPTLTNATVWVLWKR